MPQREIAQFDSKIGGRVVEILWRSKASGDITIVIEADNREQATLKLHQLLNGALTPV